jgi:hypothetical protein
MRLLEIEEPDDIIRRQWPQQSRRNANCCGRERPIPYYTATTRLLPVQCKVIVKIAEIREGFVPVVLLRCHSHART